jgi:hypothetical protein
MRREHQISWKDWWPTKDARSESPSTGTFRHFTYQVIQLPFEPAGLDYISMYREGDGIYQLLTAVPVSGGEACHACQRHKKAYLIRIGEISDITRRR